MSTTATNTTARVDELLHVDPRTLTLENNVRTITDEEQAKIDSLAESIRAVGVYNPLNGVRDEAGNIMVRDGQRRLLAALAAEVATVPVVIRHDDRDGDAREVGRITEQLLANTGRALSDSDVSAAIDDLTLFGVSPEQIAAAANLDRERVAATVATAGKAAVRQTVTDYELTLEQATALIEFEDDPDALRRLAQAAQHEQFEHTVQTIRQERADAAAREAFAQPLRDKGIGILTSWPGWQPTTPDGQPLTKLYGLVNADGQDATHADVAPERLWVYLGETETYYVRETGVEVAEHDVEWDYDPEHVDEDGQPWQLEEGIHDPATIETWLCPPI